MLWNIRQSEVVGWLGDWGCMQTCGDGGHGFETSCYHSNWNLFFALMRTIKRIPSALAPSYFFRSFYLLDSSAPYSTSHHIPTTKPCLPASLTHQSTPTPARVLHRTLDRSASEPPLAVALCTASLPHYNGTTTSPHFTTTINLIIQRYAENLAFVC